MSLQRTSKTLHQTSLCDRAQVAQQRGLALDTAGAVLKEQIPTCIVVFSQRKDCGTGNSFCPPTRPKVPHSYYENRAHTVPQGSCKARAEIELQLQVRAQLPQFLFAIYQLGVCPVLSLQEALFSLLYFHHFQICTTPDLSSASAPLIRKYDHSAKIWLIFFSAPHVMQTEGPTTSSLAVPAQPKGHHIWPTQHRFPQPQSISNNSNASCSIPHQVTCRLFLCFLPT